MKKSNKANKTINISDGLHKQGFIITSNQLTQNQAANAQQQALNFLERFEQSVHYQNAETPIHMRSTQFQTSLMNTTIATNGNSLGYNKFRKTQVLNSQKKNQQIKVTNIESVDSYHQTQGTIYKHKSKKLQALQLDPSLRSSMPDIMNVQPKTNSNSQSKGKNTHRINSKSSKISPLNQTQPIFPSTTIAHSNLIKEKQQYQQQNIKKPQGKSSDQKQQSTQYGFNQSFIENNNTQQEISRNNYTLNKSPQLTNQKNKIDTLKDSQNDTDMFLTGVMSPNPQQEDSQEKYKLNQYKQNIQDFLKAADITFKDIQAQNKPTTYRATFTNHQSPSTNLLASQDQAIKAQIFQNQDYWLTRFKEKTFISAQIQQQKVQSRMNVKRVVSKKSQSRIQFKKGMMNQTFDRQESRSTVGGLFSDGDSSEEEEEKHVIFGSEDDKLAYYQKLKVQQNDEFKQNMTKILESENIDRDSFAKALLFKQSRHSRRLVKKGQQMQQFHSLNQRDLSNYGLKEKKILIQDFKPLQIPSIQPQQPNQLETLASKNNTQNKFLEYLSHVRTRSQFLNTNLHDIYKPRYCKIYWQ